MGLRRKNVPAGHTCFAAAAFFAGHFTQAASHAGRVSERMGVNVKMPPADSPGAADTIKKARVAAGFFQTLLSVY